tara:strand:- start:953 stop:1810 length:858 start_codon:yes stop_codon:yes gene_type:complete
MTAFDQAWDIVKYDEGYWQEIYAPIMRETSGMGNLPFASQTLDFVPTSFAMDVMRNKRQNKDMSDDEWQESIMDSKLHGTGDTGFTMDELIERISEEGFTSEGMERTSRIDPSFDFSPQGLEMFEGNHRLLALNAMGAPYVPFMGIYGRRPNLPAHPYPISPAFMDLLENQVPHSLGDYLTGSGRKGFQTPPSFLYGREMVPGMGRLVPTNRLGEPIDMLSHIDDGLYDTDPLDAMLARNEREPLDPFDSKAVSRNQRILLEQGLRERAKRDFLKKPSWMVVQDE